MNVEELIDLAVTNLAYIPDAIEHKRIMEYIGTAHAAAATAQAMMMRDAIADQRIEAERDELKALWK